jgi:hypothetical protein
MAGEITDKHRLFFVNAKLEFALYFDPKIKDKDLILKNFFDSKDWKWYEKLWEVKKVIKTTISDDLREIRIEVKY